MKKLFSTSIILVLLTGCVATAPKPKTTTSSVLVEPPSHCTAPRECEIMWSDAQQAVSEISDMRIRLLTDTRIETYPPTTYGRIGAIVTKVPASDSGYDIKIQVLCYSSNCEELKMSTTRLFNIKLGFNQKMNALKAPKAPPQAQN